MPEMDGYEVIRQIREDDTKMNRHFPVIALTADVQMNQRQHYMHHGFDECLLKPVSLGQFKRLLVRWGLLQAETLKAQKENTQKVLTESMTAIDENAIVEQMGGFGSDTIEMLHLFVEMTDPLIDRIKEALNKRDTYQLAELSHSLKGAARSACAKKLGDFADALQISAELNKVEPRLVDNVVAEFENVRREVGNL
jgi:CheY-like chemotaxis protein